MKKKRFITAVNCMDGRVQEPVFAFLRKFYGADYVDMITEPGPNRILAENRNRTLVKSIKARIDISVNRHLSGRIVIVGHYDCAGNPETRKVQLGQIRLAVRRLRRWYPGIEVAGLWIDRNWKASRIAVKP